jgi:hypothetical protein
VPIAAPGALGVWACPIQTMNKKQTLDLFQAAWRAFHPVFRVELVQERHYDRPAVTTPAEVARLACDFLKDADREHFVYRRRRAYHIPMYNGG